MRESWNNLENIDKIFIILFYISFLHSILGAIFYVALLFYWQRGTEGCVKSLLLVTARGIISSAVAATPRLQILRWVIILGASLFILLKEIPSEEDTIKYRNVTIMAGIFATLVGFSSLVFSSYPVTSVFKMISFIIPFLAVLKGVSGTKYYCKWNEYFFLLFGMLFAVSAILIPFGRFRITNGNFQGVFNQVNMLGIMGAIFLISVLSSNYLKKRSVIRAAILVLTFVMLYLSASRTGMFSAVTVLLVYLLFTRRDPTHKVYSVIAVFFLGIIIYFIMNSEVGVTVQQALEDFIYKGNTSSIFASRESQLELYRSKYEANKMFGTGFMIPYSAGIRDYALNFNLIVEPGNIIWTLLGDTGLIGTVCFALLILVIIIQGEWSRLYMLVGALMINMGEMVFFSSNNISILIYFFIAIYMFGEPELDYGGSAFELST